MENYRIPVNRSLTQRFDGGADVVGNNKKIKIIK